MHLLMHSPVFLAEGLGVGDLVLSDVIGRHVALHAEAAAGLSQQGVLGPANPIQW